MSPRVPIVAPLLSLSSSFFPIVRSPWSGVPNAFTTGCFIRFIHVNHRRTSGGGPTPVLARAAFLSEMHAYFWHFLPPALNLILQSACFTLRLLPLSPCSSTTPKVRVGLYWAVFCAQCSCFSCHLPPRNARERR